MTLDRLWKLIALSSDSEEGRTAAVMVCRMIRDEGLIITEPNSTPSKTDWTSQVATEDIACCNCEDVIFPGERVHINRVDGKLYHGGCLP